MGQFDAVGHPTAPVVRATAPRISLVTNQPFLRPWSEIAIGLVMVIGSPLYWRYVVPGMARRPETRRQDSDEPGP